MKRILVVDDDPSTLDVIILLFEMEGYEVLGLKNCLDLYHSISNFAPNIILLDVIMGSVDGRDICKELKLSQHRNIPVLQMSVVNKFYKDPQKPLHADDYIEKPFDLDVMVSKVQSLMNNAQIN
ncbi:MAG: response regulator [Pedobacter sp.]|nr:MAG: response regulator [Pedobacter sp.]